VHAPIRATNLIKERVKERPFGALKSEGTLQEASESEEDDFLTELLMETKSEKIEKLKNAERRKIEQSLQSTGSPVATTDLDDLLDF
jgi:hypothetical protein